MATEHSTTQVFGPFLNYAQDATLIVSASGSVTVEVKLGAAWAAIDDSPVATVGPHKIDVNGVDQIRITPAGGTTYSFE
ncbi:MAG: hypothetical protein ACPG4X_19270 [Pikeienuella sp.]